jgi:predicted amidohydrolase
LSGKKIKIATCQFAVSGDLQQNSGKILLQMRKAWKRGAEIIHFPECCLTGYGGIHLTQIRKENYRALGPSLEEIALQARQLGVYVIVGTHYFEHGFEKPKNSLLVINAEGQIVDRYDKRVLAGRMDTMDHKYYGAGDRPVIFDFQGISCGLVICHEWRYPELYREYKKLGAEVIFHSWLDGGLDNERYYKSGKEEGELIIGAVKGYAANNYLWVSGSNISNHESCFASFVIQPNGMVVNKARRNREQVLITEIDLSEEFEDPSFYERQRFL